MDGARSSRSHLTTSAERARAFGVKKRRSHQSGSDRNWLCRVLFFVPAAIDTFDAAAAAQSVSGMTTAQSPAQPQSQSADAGLSAAPLLSAPAQADSYWRSGRTVVRALSVSEMIMIRWQSETSE